VGGRAPRVFRFKIGKISTRFAQYLVCLPKLTVLAFQRFQLISDIRCHAGASVGIDFSLLYPIQQCARRAADFGSNRRNSRLARGVIDFMIQNHPHRALTYFWREFIGRLT